MLEPLRPDVISPPAIVQVAFDEARAIAEIKEAVARRDEAKGEYHDALIVVGQKLLEARRAMPDVPGRGYPKLSPGFCAFVEKTGLALSTAKGYMSWARDPKRLEAARKRRAIRGDSDRVRRYRRKTLEEVRALLTEAPDLETARRVIAEELNELAA